MASSPYKTLGNIRSAVVSDAKEQSSTNLITQLNRWINEGYEQVNLRKKREWLDTQFYTQLPAPTEATATVTNGTPTVTFTAGTTFPSSTYERILYNTGYSEIYDVNSTTGLVATLLQNYLGTTNTSANCVVAVKSIILDSSIKEVYRVYHQHSKEPLIIVGPEQFRDIVENYGQNLEKARYATIFGQNNTSASKRLMIYPYPDEAYTLYYDAKVNIVPLSADADEPVLLMQERQLLYHYGMYKLYSYHRNDAKASECLNSFNIMLMKIDGEAKAQLDFPQIVVAYKRGRRRSFLPGFNSGMREDP